LTDFSDILFSPWTS